LIWVVVATAITVEPPEVQLLSTLSSAVLRKDLNAEVASVGNDVTLRIDQPTTIETNRTSEVTLTV
jgi:ribosome recycling factor